MIKVTFLPPTPASLPCTMLKTGDTFILEGGHDVFIVTDEASAVVNSVSINSGFRHVITDPKVRVVLVHVEAHVTVGCAHLEEFKRAPRGERVDNQ